MIKSLTIITHAPQGTLGDPALCDHLAQNLQANYPDLKIKLVVCSIDRPGHWRAVDDIINKNNNLTVSLLPGVIQDLTTKQKEELYSNTDAVIIYPTFHFMSARERVELNELRQKVPVIYITNYNFQEQKRYNRSNASFCEKNPQITLQTYEELLEQGHILETGLINKNTGLKLLGINLAETPKDQSVDLNEKDKSALNESDTKSITRILNVDNKEELSNVALDKYKLTNDLYLAYYNNLNLEATYNWQNAPSFVKMCVLYSLQRNKKSKTIDVVLPLQEHSDSKNNLNEVTSQLPLDLVTVEYWKKDPQTGELYLDKKMGIGQTVVRLINAFPFARSGMDLLERISDPFTLVTGNSSLSEAIDYHKVFLYQVMSWHTRLDTDFLAMMTDDAVFHSTHPYRRFFELVHSSIEHKEARLVELLINHLNEIIKGAKHFYEYLNRFHNLKKSLPEKLMTKIQQEKDKLKPTSVQALAADSQDPDSFITLQSSRYLDKLLKFKNTNKIDDADKDDLLLLACMLQDEACASKLIGYGANPNTTRKSNGMLYNPLYFCLTANVNEALLRILSTHKDFDPLSSIKTIRQNPKCKPYKKLQEGYPHYLMVEILIKSAQRQGQNPTELFSDKELKAFCARNGCSYSATCNNNDLIYLDIFFSADILRPLDFLYDIKKFYLKHYPHKLLQRNNLREILDAYLLDDNSVTILDSAFQKYHHDLPFLRDILYLSKKDNSCLIIEYLVQHPSDLLVTQIAKKVLTEEEFQCCLKQANDKIAELDNLSFEEYASDEESYRRPNTVVHLSEQMEQMWLNESKVKSTLKPPF